MIVKYFLKNIDKRVIAISGVSISAALVFWGCTALLRKIREQKSLTLWRVRAQSEGKSTAGKDEIEKMIKTLSNEDLKNLIAMAEHGTEEVDFKKEILQMQVQAAQGR